MIHTTIYHPALALAEYVCHLAIREFNSVNDVLLKPMHAKHEIHMMFMINCKMHDFKNHELAKNPHSFNKKTEAHCTFSGILTSTPGHIVFKGPIRLLVIHFKPTGFFRLFDISPKEITDYLGDSVDILSNEVIRLHEQLHEARTDEAVFELTARFLMEKLAKKKARFEHTGIIRASEFLINGAAKLPIKELASQTNMTLKTFERKFIDYVGVSPKLYERILRFNRSLEMKLYWPEIAWTKICHDVGYFDQTHMIKDFHAFAGQSPKAFFGQMPPPPEKIKRYCHFNYSARP